MGRLDIDWGEVPARGPQVNTVANAQGRFGCDKTNPIPVDGPLGEFQYLARLRCRCGEPFVFDRLGSYGYSPDGHVIDGYELLCRKRVHKLTLFMDMYHEGPSALVPEGLATGEAEGKEITAFRRAKFPEGLVDAPGQKWREQPRALLEGLRRLFRRVLRERAKWLNLALSWEQRGRPSLRRAQLSGADLRQAELPKADLSVANLAGANLAETYLRAANLMRANLAGANLLGANLMGASLVGANLRQASLVGAELQRARLWGTSLWGADLRGADLQDARLWDVSLTGANLRGANLQEAQLWDVSLEGANLQGANLRGATLEKTYLNSARADAKTIWPEDFTVPNTVRWVEEG